MTPELEQKLLKRFPVLYRHYYSPMQQTCMCWGFSHGDGWFPIIWQLSLAIEDELGYNFLLKKWILFRYNFQDIWNRWIYRISPVRLNKYKMIGKGTKEDPIRQELVEEAKPTWDEWLVRTLFGKYTHIGKFKTTRIALKKLAIVNDPYFHVDQVKEKFGTLRFYCPSNDQIWKYISMAETLSAKICEVCGKWGKLREDRSWVQTLCDECAAPKNVQSKS